MLANSIENKILIISGQLGHSNIDLPDFKIFPNCDYFFITDQNKNHNVWNFLEPINFSFDLRYSNRRNCKIYKILPFLFFTNYHYIIWHDCTSFVKKDPNIIVSKYLKHSDFAFFKHPLRDCIYDELKVVSSEPIDSIENLTNYKSFLEQIGYKKKSGLFEATSYAMKITKSSVACMLSWWELICRFSSRDQLSLPIALSYHNIKPSILPGSGQNYGGNNELIPSMKKSFRESKD